MMFNAVGAVAQILDQLLLGPEELVNEGKSCLSSGFRVLPDCCRVSDATAVAEFDVDIGQRINLRPEVTAEDPELCDEQWPAGVGVVVACALQQPSDEAVGGLPADRFPEAGHGQGVAKNGRFPPDVAVIVDIGFWLLS